MANVHQPLPSSWPCFGGIGSHQSHRIFTETLRNGTDDEVVEVVENEERSKWSERVDLNHTRVEIEWKLGSSLESCWRLVLAIN